MRAYESWILFSAFMVFAVYIFYVIKYAKTKPDPWENELSREEVEKLKREICLNCGAEVKPGQYYCPKCNHATGRYVPYLPFVNIAFNYSMHRTLWSKLKAKDHNIIYKLIVIFFILCTAPIMIVAYLVILPFRLIFLSSPDNENENSKR